MESINLVLHQVESLVDQVDLAAALRAVVKGIGDGHHHS